MSRDIPYEGMPKASSTAGPSREAPPVDGEGEGEDEGEDEGEGGGEALAPPRRLVFADLLSAVRDAPPKERRERCEEAVTLLRRSDSLPCLVGAGDLPTFLPVLVNALLRNPAQMKAEAKAAFLDGLFDPEEAAALLEKAARSMVVACAGGIGTHNLKVPNPLVSGKGGVFMNDGIRRRAAALPFVSSATVRCRKGCNGAGNAADMPAMRLLTTRFEYGGAVLDLVDALTQDGEVAAALVARGLPRDAAEAMRDVLRARMRGPDVDLVHPLLKTLYEPMGPDAIAADSYRALTSLQSNGLGVELAARLNERRAAGRIIRTRDTRVGSGKPQNAGMLMLDLGGRHAHLVGWPPARLGGSGRLPDCLGTLRNRGTLFGGPTVARLDRDALAALLDLIAASGWANADARAALRRRTDGLTLDVLALAGVAAAVLEADDGEDSPLAGPAFATVADWEKRLLDPRLRGGRPLSAEDAAAASEAVCGVVEGGLAEVQKGRGRELILDDALRRMIGDSASAHIQTLF